MPRSLHLLAAGCLASLSLLMVKPVLAHEYESGAVTVSHPWARATPGGATIGAAYVTIAAKDGPGDILLGASTPAAGRVEIHTHIMDGDVMKMRRIEKLVVPGGGKAMLKPSGDHIMLFDLKAPLKEGDLVPLTLVFEKAGEIKVDATVEPVGATGPHGLKSQTGDDGHAGHDHQ